MVWASPCIFIVVSWIVPHLDVNIRELLTRLHVFFYTHCVGVSLMHPTWFVSVATFSRGHAECKFVCARV